MNLSNSEHDEDLGYWIALTRVTGIGPRRFQLLVDAFGAGRAVWEASERQLADAGLDRRTVDALAKTRRVVAPEREVENLRRVGARAIIRSDSDYPTLLAEIYDPPPVIYVRGELDAVDTSSIAIVGTRGATAYGRMVAEDLAGGLGRAGVTVVSGLALGVDGSAHRGALQAGGRTIAVLAHGLDRTYPSQHARLAQNIAAQGALVTEFPLGTKPDAVNFPRRNRIISGLTSGTLVVEAGDRSGALITAAFATEQGRDVMAVPGSIFSPMSKGPNNLIRDGATPVTRVEDVLAELQPSRVVRQLTIESILPADETQRALMQCLGAEPTHIDEIAQRAALPMSAVSSTLAMMELNGLVRQTGGMHYVRSTHS
ncbi:MAG: putative processing protein [Chloroflexi bacterium]|nr:putative processing protein [Chloroflexota bacterium]